MKIAAIFVIGPHNHHPRTELELMMAIGVARTPLEGHMLDAAEIARFRDNLDCRLAACDWYEDKDGVAWCEACGSGYLPSAREFLRRRAARSATIVTGAIKESPPGRRDP